MTGQTKSRVAPVDAVARYAAMALAAPLAFAAVIGLGDDVDAPFLIAVGGGLVVSLALTRLIASALLLAAGTEARRSAVNASVRGGWAGLRVRLPQPCR